MDVARSRRDAATPKVGPEADLCSLCRDRVVTGYAGALPNSNHRTHYMSADGNDSTRGLTRRHVLESGAALAILGYVRPGFAAEVNPLAPPVLPSDPDVSTHAGQVHGQRRRADPHRSTPGPRCSTPCASTSASPGPRRGATTASAAPARCWSTGGASIRACRLAAMHEGDQITTIEGMATGETVASAAGRLRPSRRVPMRLLHARARSCRPPACWPRPRRASRAW